jgi:hypothetical protein
MNFFGYVDLKKKQVGYPSVMHFEGRTIHHQPSDPGPDLVLDDLPFGALQFTLDEVQSVLLEMDVSKDADLDGVPPLILKNCAPAFSRPLSLLFNRFLSTIVFPNRWKLSDVKPIFQKDRHNNVEDYRGVIICNFEAF